MTVYLLTQKQAGMQYAMDKNEYWFKRARTDSGRGWRKWEPMQYAVGHRAKDFFLSIGAELASPVHTRAVRLP